jgi:hypothetical protein
MYPSPAPRFAVPDSKEESLVVAKAAATAAPFFLNVVTADDGSRPGKSGGSGEGEKPESRAGSGPFNVHPAKVVHSWTTFAGSTLMANLRCLL